VNISAKCSNPKCASFGVEKSVVVGQLLRYGAANDRVTCPTCGELMTTTETKNVSSRRQNYRSSGRGSRASKATDVPAELTVKRRRNREPSRRASERVSSLRLVAARHSFGMKWNENADWRVCKSLKTWWKGRNRTADASLFRAVVDGSYLLDSPIFSPLFHGQNQPIIGTIMEQLLRTFSIHPPAAISSVSFSTALLCDSGTTCW